MKIRMLAGLSGPRTQILAGAVINAGDETARRLIAKGLAEPALKRDTVTGPDLPDPPPPPPAEAPAPRAANARRISAGTTDLAPDATNPETPKEPAETDPEAPAETGDDDDDDPALDGDDLTHDDAAAPPRARGKKG